MSPLGTGNDGTERPRVGVLIHAASVDATAAGGLAGLVSFGSVVVCRAYGDWTQPGLRAWLSELRHHRIRPVHQFQTRAEHDPSLVALTIDAVDLTRDAALDWVVLVGDIGAAVPLVDRLREARARVVVVGPRSTPHELRRACDEFVHLEDLDDPPAGDRGRHRA